MNRATINAYLEPLKELISTLEAIEASASAAADEARMDAAWLTFWAAADPLADGGIARAEAAAATNLAEGHAEMALAAAVASTRIRGLFV